MGEVTNVYKILVRSLKETDHSENFIVGGRMGLREIECDDVDQIFLARYRDQWLAVVITVMDLWVP
jgi:hypothetical protein